MDKEDLFASPPSSSACADSDSDPLLTVAGPSVPSGFQLGSPRFLDDTNVLNYTEEPIELAYIPPGGKQPPPKFTPYKAEFFISGREIVSHDPHLNEDGEALYRFLLSQAKRRPDYYLHLRGTHEEKKSRIVSDTDLHGDTTHETEDYTETVTDFDFYIDLTPQIVHGPVHWSLPDTEATYRGEMVLEVDSNDPPDPTRDLEAVALNGRRSATKEEKRVAKARRATRKNNGLPPWVRSAPGSWFRQSNVPPAPAVALKSSKTLRQWADEYCASDKLLKEFTYKKVVYGWNLVKLRDGVAAVIRAVYRHDIYVTYELEEDKIRIRPDNRLSRTLSNRCFKFLLWITLIYPVIWLYKRFSQRGGGRWEVCGGAYALKTWEPLPPGAPLAAPERTRVLPDGRVLHLVGEGEDEWFKRWEGIIRDHVIQRTRTSTPISPRDPRPKAISPRDPRPPIVWNGQGYQLRH